MGNCGVIAWWRHQMETFPRHYPFVRGIHRWPVDFPHKGQWRGALMFSLICIWTNWYADLQVKPLLRSYRLYKRKFPPEYYLDCITLPKHRVSISKIRASSHDLEIECGRYTRPKIDQDHRLCAFCLEIENEEHFVTNCQINAAERQLLFTKISSKFPAFAQPNHHEKFIYLMSCNDRQILTWLGIFLYKSFDIRNTKIYGSCIPSKQ